MANIRYEKRDHVVTITLDHPHVHNCIDRATCTELQRAWGMGTFDQFRVDVYNSEGYCGYTRRADISSSASRARWS